MSEYSQMYLLIGGIVGGLVLSQGVSTLRKIYDMLYTSELRREKLLQECTEKIEKFSQEMKKEIKANFEAEKEKHSSFLKSKSEVLDNKLSLVLSKLTSSCVTSKGSYKTRIGMEEEGLKHMTDIVKEASGQLSQNYSKVLAKYGSREDQETKQEINREQTKNKIVSNEEQSVKIFQQMRPVFRNNEPKEILEPPCIEVCNEYKSNQTLPI